MGTYANLSEILEPEIQQVAALPPLIKVIISKHCCEARNKPSYINYWLTTIGTYPGHITCKCHISISSESCTNIATYGTRFQVDPIFASHFSESFYVVPMCSDHHHVAKGTIYLVPWKLLIPCPCSAGLEGTRKTKSHLSRLFSLLGLQ